MIGIASSGLPNIRKLRLRVSNVVLTYSCFAAGFSHFLALEHWIKRLSDRRPIPDDLRDRLLTANRHTCCICHEPRQPVEIHHINSNPGENSWDNLAVLCRNCHGLVSANGNLGRRYTAGEVRRYKAEWELRCHAAADEIESPVEELHETKLIDANSHETYEFEMEEGDELIFSIAANDYLDAVICDEEDIDEWADGEFYEKRPLPDEYWWSRTQIMEGANYKFTAPQDGLYVMLLVNWAGDETELTVDAAVWKRGD